LTKKRVLHAVIGLLATLAMAEAAIRWVSPNPRVQVVRPSSFSSDDGPGKVLDVEGTPIWRHRGSTLREHLDCDEPQRPKALLLGSSILFGVGLEAQDAVSGRLPELLAPDGEGWCVHNHSQPAFTAQGRLAVARQVLPILKPKVVVWEVWTGDAGTYEIIGDTAYELSSFPVDSAGFPRVSWAPAPIHHLLFTRSTLWEIGTLALLQRDNRRYASAWRRVTDETLPEILHLTQANGGQLMLVVMPPLDRPFADAIEPHRDFSFYRPLYTWAKREGVPVHDVAKALIHESHEALRLDPCCHYNEDGHRALAQAMAPWIEAASSQEQLHP